jgi:hypothetical protein
MLNPVLAFALTALVIEITPGPNMTYLAALSLSSGTRTGFAAVAGIALGLLTYGVIAAVGLAALIDNSPVLYGLLRWGGVGYLLWLAWESWSSERETSPDETDGNIDPPWLAFRRGLITNLLNPKAAVFYVAVASRFHPGRRRLCGDPDAALEHRLRVDRDCNPCGDRCFSGNAASDHRRQASSANDTARFGARPGRHRDLVRADHWKVRASLKFSTIIRAIFEMASRRGAR